jgi:hypothetical protein
LTDIDKKVMNLLDKLRGGDLRSIGRSNEVINTNQFHTKTGSPAVQARGRKLLQRLKS